MAISIEDLPRLTDEDREALDAYVAVEGVPVSCVCLNCKGSGTDPSEGHLCEACEGSGNSSAPHPLTAAEAPKRARFLRRASILIAVATAVSLTACSPTHIGVLVVGAIAAHETDSGKPPAAS